jgi:Mu transposase-like protein
MPVKGKDERGVGYVKSNAIAGRRFASWSELEAHLEAWTREVADVRVHGTTGEAPIERFTRDEATALRPLAGTPPFINARDLLRRVGADCAIEVDGNAYSVPWRLIGERVRVTVGGGSPPCQWISSSNVSGCGRATISCSTVRTIRFLQSIVAA